MRMRMRWRVIQRLRNHLDSHALPDIRIQQEFLFRQERQERDEVV